MLIRKKIACKNNISIEFSINTYKKFDIPP